MEGQAGLGFKSGFDPPMAGQLAGLIMDYAKDYYIACSLFCFGTRKASPKTLLWLLLYRPKPIHCNYRLFCHGVCVAV